MKERSPGVADIFRMHSNAFRARYGHQTSVYHERTLREMACCRTNVLGGHLEQCESCNYKEYRHNSCCNRLCPTCQWSQRRKRNERQAELLLPVQHHHVVFTVPDELAQLDTGNQYVFYRALFLATKTAILLIGTQCYGVQLGLIIVLHTWGQLMNNHGHTHSMLPAGGLSLDGKRWIALPRDVPLPEELLLAAFQKSFIAYLRAAYRYGNLRLRGQYAALDVGKKFYRFLNEQHDRKWIMHAEVANQQSRKRTRFDQLVEQADGPALIDEDAARAMKYLTSYSSGTVMTDDRIVSVTESDVTFTYKDYRDNSRVKEAIVDPLDFIWRFLQHVLPQRMRHIRHYGFYAHRDQTDNVAFIRSLLEDQRVTTTATNDSSQDVEEPEQQEATDSPSESAPRCPSVAGR